MLLFDGIFKKIIGLLTTLILARLLTPEDFGIVATSVLALGILETLSKNSSFQYLTVANTIDEHDLHRAFAINFIQKILVVALFILTIPYIVQFYQDERLFLILVVVAFGLFCVGLENPRTAIAIRNQEYLPLIKATILAKVIATVASILFAYYTKSYWALIIGQIVNQILPVLFSYIIYPFKPRLSVSNLKKSKTMISFSIWALPSAIFGYIRTQIDVIFVSKFFSQAELGSYHVMKYYALIPNANIIGPMLGPLPVHLSKLYENRFNFDRLFSFSFFMVYTLSVSISYFIYENSYNFVELMLGIKWVEYSYILGCFSMISTLGLLTSQVLAYYTISLKGSKVFIFELFLFLFMIIYIMYFYFYEPHTIKNFIYLRVISEVFFFCILFVYVYIKEINFSSFFNTLISCLIATSAIYYCGIISKAFDTESLLLSLLLKFFIYFLCLVSSIILFSIVFKRVNDNYKLLNMKMIDILRGVK